MKNYYIILLIAFTFNNAGERCSFNTDIIFRTEDGRYQSERDAKILSPKGYFYIHYDTLGNNAPNDIIDGNSEYVYQVSLAADSSWAVEIDLMGFHPPPEDEDGIYDIYIHARSEGQYGVNYKDDNKRSSYINIDNDYINEYPGIGNDWKTEGLPAMQVTVAHEFFHAIQRWYTSDGTNGTYDSYFWEFTSTWIEDIIYPDSNDYLYFIENFDLEENYDLTTINSNLPGNDGYKFALYGHYLSSIVEGVANEMNSTIMLSVWENIEIGALQSLKNVLSDYNVTFSTTWIDFISRNLYNGVFQDVDNDIYYYIDQANPILNDFSYGLSYTSLIPGEVEFSLNDKSADISSFNVVNGSVASLSHDILPTSGKVAVVSNILDNNKIINLVSDLAVSVSQNEKIHFIYGLDEGSGSVLLDITLHYFPLPPSNVQVQISDDSHIITWDESLSPGGHDILHYNVYRNSILIASPTETRYVDTEFEKYTNYIYTITAENENGESSPSDPYSFTSSIYKTQIVSLYPNPITEPGYQLAEILVNYVKNYNNVTLDVIDIRGKVVMTIFSSSREHGRIAEDIGYKLDVQTPSGIYFARLNYDGQIDLIKFTIYK